MITPLIASIALSQLVKISPPKDWLTAVVGADQTQVAKILGDPVLTLTSDKISTCTYYSTDLELIQIQFLNAKPVSILIQLRDNPILWTSALQQAGIFSENFESRRHSLRHGEFYVHLKTADAPLSQWDILYLPDQEIFPKKIDSPVRAVIRLSKTTVVL